MAIWNEAEAALAAALDEFVGAGNWRENPGDGAFYGPKIDIQVARQKLPGGGARETPLSLCLR